MTLFDFLPPAASNADPGTSHDAAREVEKSGARARQVLEVVAAVREYPGLTSRELAAKTGKDRHMVARRLPDAVKVGLVFQGTPRPCAATGGRRQAVTWFPVERSG